MDELIKQISDKLKISTETVRKVILATADYLKTKVPESVGRDIELALDLKDVTEEEIRFVGLFKVP